MERKQYVTKIIFAIYCLFLTWLVLFKMTFSFDDIQWFEMNRRLKMLSFSSKKAILFGFAGL